MAARPISNSPSDFQDSDMSSKINLPQSTGATDSQNVHSEASLTKESVNELDDSREATPPRQTSAPPLPNELPPPPLPAEAPPQDDGWEPIWDEKAQAYYFHNRFTKATQWENPRVPTEAIPGIANHDRIAGKPSTGKTWSATNSELHPAVRGGYNPAIHGDYDPNADYAQETVDTVAISHDAFADEQVSSKSTDPYIATGAFNRFTGRFQTADLNPENHNDENKSRRQMSAFFDVDASANSHDGRSLKAERANKKLSKSELKKFKEKRREKKEERRRAWLKD